MFFTYEIKRRVTDFIENIIMSFDLSRACILIFRGTKYR